MPALESVRSFAAIKRVAVGIVTTAVLLTGCAAPGGDAHVVDPAEIVAGYDCLAPNLGGWLFPPDPSSSPDPLHPDAPEPGRVPAGLVPTTAVRCDLMASIDDAEGRWTGVTAVTLEGDLTEVLSALSEPDDGLWPGPCTADAEFVPPLWLIDATGRAINAHYPRNGCGKTKPGVRKALAGLKVGGVATHKRTLVEPRAPLDSGCVAKWKAPFTEELGLSIPSTSPLPALDGASQIPSRPLAVTVPPDLDGMRWCRYVAEPASSGASGEASALPGSIALRTGRFAAGGMLDAETAQLVADAAASEPVPRSCEATSTSFLVLWPIKGGQALGMTLTAELDGCGLLYREGSGTRPLPDNVRGILTALTE
ncbi:hypothetical protein V1638_12030 [Pseudarthrobacter sp. J64]|uniref:hypothetical protein n=1 Tax=Pseudarthrobacter sp. J64 TaxID=3116485 RepID=UPI002E81C418|nr:hypothetical protein [Pseudarthrobacter sp. J64]MEE2570119.1 hypothetical protein [Pseudarthrobacter sp. J64]